MKRQFIALLVVLVSLSQLPANAQTSSNLVSVEFDTNTSTPLSIGFAGYTTELLGTGVEYGDTNMQYFASMLSPGWLLFPAGSTGDAFDWATGQTDTNWVNEFTAKGDSTIATLTQDTVKSLVGKGGVWLTNFASLAGNLGGAKIMVCVNGFTDSSTSIGAEAAFALSNHIPVAVWELCNEPYNLKGSNNFFSNGTDYANKMKPFHDAIKAADPNAVVAVFYSDPGNPDTAWDNALNKYTNQYWEAVAYHYYPRMGTNYSFQNLMALDNANLASNSTLYVSNVFMPSNSANVTFLLTELNPNLGNSSGSTQYPPTSTLYGGIFASEYIMRLSTMPRVGFAGSYQLVDGSGVDTTNSNYYAVTNAAAHGFVTNTQNDSFGYFLSAQGSAEAVAFWALNRSTVVYPTTVGSNCPVVSMDTNGITTMPAVYAQAYNGCNGKRYVLLTNKGTNPVTVQIIQNGTNVTKALLETYVTGADPSAVNSNPPANNVAILTQPTNSPVSIPEYSVVRLEWPEFTVPQTTLGVTISGAAPTLTWMGLTSVVYNVQCATNLFGPWTTLERVGSAQTNFSYTDLNASGPRFYRLAVP
jgi:hypothetical protein